MRAQQAAFVMHLGWAAENIPEEQRVTPRGWVSADHPSPGGARGAAQGGTHGYIDAPLTDSRAWRFSHQNSALLTVHFAKIPLHQL